MKAGTFVSNPPDTFLKSGRFLDEKLAHAEVPEVQVLVLDRLERSSKMKMKKTSSNLPGIVKV